jgi:hypothetical protein
LDDLIANRNVEHYASFMLLIGAVFALIVGVTYFIPIVMPGLLIVAVGAGASVAVSKIVFGIFGAPDKSR